MSLTNAKITTSVDVVSRKFKQLLDAMNESLHAQKLPFIDPHIVLKFLLFSPNHPLTNMPNPLTLPQLNQNYHSFIINNQLLLSSQSQLVEELSDLESDRALANIIEIHLHAVANGFTQAYKDNKTFTITNRISKLLEAMNHTQQLTQQDLIEPKQFITLLTQTEKNPFTGVATPLSFTVLCANYAMLVNSQNFNLTPSLIETK